MLRTNHERLRRGDDIAIFIGLLYFQLASSKVGFSRKRFTIAKLQSFAGPESKTMGLLSRASEPILGVRQVATIYDHLLFFLSGRVENVLLLCSKWGMLSNP